MFHSYENQRIEIRHVAQAPQQLIQPQPYPQQELRYLRDLQSIDPYEFPVSQNQKRGKLLIYVPFIY